MKLSTTLAILSVTMILIAQMNTSNANSRSTKLERRVKKTNKDGASSSDATPIGDGDVTVIPFGNDNTKFYLFGDTGQVDKYFDDFVKRSIPASNIKTLEKLVVG